MRRLARQLVDHGPPALLVGAIALNIVNWRRGRPTICTHGRAVVRPDTLTGQIAFHAGWAAFAWWWFPDHFCYPKRP